MSYHQFVEYAVSLKNHSDTIDDGWAMCEYTNALVSACGNKKFLHQGQKYNIL